MSAKPKKPAKGQPQEKSHPILVAVIGASGLIIVALISGFFTVVLPNLNT